MLLFIGIIIVVAAALCAATIVPLRPLLQRYAMSRPNFRSMHLVPTPQGGGIAVIAAVIVVSVAAILLGQTANADFLALGTVAAATIMIATVGAIDDICTLGAAPRLLLQTLAVALVIYALPSGLRIFEFMPWGMERLLLLITGVWFVNLVNFMDGIDWITVAEVVPVTGGLILLGLDGALPVHAVIVAAALAGAMIGFAPFNRPVARLFLGDVGSLPIGLLLGWLLALLAGSGHIAAALLLPLYYLTDATVTLFQRILRRETLWDAHRMHFYQRAVDHGFSTNAVVARLFAVNIALIMLALISAYWPSLTVALLTMAAGFVIVIVLLTTFARRRG